MTVVVVVATANNFRIFFEHFLYSSENWFSYTSVFELEAIYKITQWENAHAKKCDLTQIAMIKSLFLFSVDGLFSRSHSSLIGFGQRWERYIYIDSQDLHCDNTAGVFHQCTGNFLFILSNAHKNVWHFFCVISKCYGICNTKTSISAQKSYKLLPLLCSSYATP